LALARLAGVRACSLSEFRCRAACCANRVGVLTIKQFAYLFLAHICWSITIHIVMNHTHTHTEHTHARAHTHTCHAAATRMHIHMSFHGPKTGTTPQSTESVVVR